MQDMNYFKTALDIKTALGLNLDKILLVLVVSYLHILSLLLFELSCQ